MALPYVPFYENMLETADALSAEEFGELARAYIRYAFERQSYEEAVSSLSQESRLLFGILKNQADHCNRISRVRSRVAATRRRTSSVTPEQKGAKGSKKEQNADGEKKRKKTMKEKTKKKVAKKKKKKEKAKEKGEKKEPFSPPALEEIKAFLGRKNLQDYAEPFFDYYTGNGWMMGLAPMKDWRGAVMSWIRCNRRLTANSSPEPGNLGKHLPVQDYNQRDYSDMQQKAMER